MVEVGLRFVARLIACIDRDRCREVLIMQQGEERYVEGVVGRKAGAGRRVASVPTVANLHARLRVWRCDSVDHQLRPTVFDVMEGRHDRESGRIKSHLHVGRDRRAPFAQAKQHWTCRRHHDPGRTPVELGVRRSVERAGDPDTVWTVLSDLSVFRLVEREKGVPPVVLLDDGFERAELSLRSLDDGLEDGGATN